MVLTQYFLLATTAASALAATVDQQLSLHRLAKKTGRYFGTAHDVRHLTDTAYNSRVAAEFGQLTHENALKWESTEPTQGVFNFENSEAVYAFAKSNHFIVRGHTLVWHSQLPAWVTNGNFTKPALIEVIKSHIRGVAGHYRGRIHTWDVVNEAVTEEGGLRPTVFSDTIGEEYIDIAFKTAHAVDPKAKLAINDYNIDGTGPKSTGLYELVKRLKRRGVPIDQIGAQAHLIVGQLPTDIQQNWEKFASLGVTVAVTEIDIRMQLPVTEEKLAQQAADYTTVVKACLAIQKCVGLTVWVASDKYSWVPDVFDGEGAACIWDEEYNNKPADTAVRKTLAGGK